jgi:hypothetical protein
VVHLTTTMSHGCGFSRVRALLVLVRLGGEEASVPYVPGVCARTRRKGSL